MLKLSRFVYFCNNNVLWHSLFGQSVKLSGELYQQLKKNKTFKKTDSSITKLIRLNFITDKATDDKILQKAKDEIKDKGYNNLFLIMTNQCNLACKYCFYQKTYGLRQRLMSFETAKKAIDLFVKKHNKNEKSLNWFCQITFYGGEPLLNFDCIKKATEYLQELKKAHKLPQKTQLVINTNGTLISKKVVDWAKQNNVQVQISIDGNQKTHDANRVFLNGSGSYKQTIAGMQKLVRSDIDILPLITVSNGNITKLPELVYDLCKKYKLKHYGMNLLIDLGNKSSGTYPEEASDQMVKTCQKTSKLGVSDDVIDSLFENLKNFKIVKQSCGIARKLTVFPDGKIYACQAISNHKKSAIGELEKGLTSTENVSYWNNYTRFNNKNCLKCKYLAFCGGGCVASSLFRHKRLSGIDEHYCRWIRHMMNQYFNPEDYLVEHI